MRQRWRARPAGPGGLVGRRTPVDVFWASAALDLPWLDGLADPSEVDRARRYRRAEDRLRSVRAAGLLRYAVSQVLRVAPGSLRLARECTWCGGEHGRPRVVGADVDVSVSHSGRWVLVAVTGRGRVGVDVEDASPGARPPTDPSLVLAPGERAEGERALLHLWTAKEAYLKALGVGLTVEPARVSVRGDRASTPRQPSGRTVDLTRGDHPATLCLVGAGRPVVRLHEIDGGLADRPGHTSYL